MERINNILKDSKYTNYLNLNSQAEKERIFCHHDLNHLLDVARVAYIIVLEDKLNIAKEIVYAASLLHDIGRWKEYEDGSDHAIVSAELAEEILIDCKFNKDEIKIIQEAIAHHRRKTENISSLGAVLYKSDKISRPCGQCSVIGQCKRFVDGREFELEY